jgi:hypothetical protein
MTKLFEHAADVARGLPRVKCRTTLLGCAPELASEDQPVVELTPQEQASFRESLAQADRREFATDEEVRMVWAKYGL